MTIITRRQGLVGGIAAMAAAALPGRIAAAAAPEGLDAIARRRGLRFGSAVAFNPRGGSFTNPGYAALLRADCGLLVPENEMKWQWLRPGPDRFNFAAFDAMIGWAEKNRMEMRGHNLLWHRRKWMPRWLEAHDFGARPSSEAARLLTTHIETVTRRYGTRIKSYDVVNETVTPETGALEETALSRALGGTEATVDLAFRTARAAAPHAELVYNDYMSWEPGNEQHRAGVLRLLEGFRRRGTPVDALGLQSHLITQGVDAGASVTALQGEWRRFLDAVTGMGYKLLITELDVRDNALPADVVSRDRAVADFTRGYLEVTLYYPQLRDVLAWGMSDRFSWIEGFEPRADHARRRPCPYDDGFRAKPMRDGIAAALAGALTRA
jgi:endo-1,4-beta-xylanase